MGGERHPVTLISIGNLADLLRATGALVEAEAVLGTNAVAVAQEVFGSNHMHTLLLTAKAVRLQHAQPGGAAAGKELLAATVARMAEVLGDTHPQTCKYTGRFSLRWSEKCRGERVQHVFTFHVFVPTFAPAAAREQISTHAAPQHTQNAHASNQS